MANYGELTGGGLNAYYKFENNANDSSPNARNLTLTSAGYTTASKVGAYALDNFTSSGGCANIVDNTGIVNSYDPVTVILWLYLKEQPPTTGDKRGFIFARATSAKVQHDAVYNYVSAGNYRLDFRLVNWQVNQYSYNGTLPLNQWTHIALSYAGTGNAVRAFINAKYLGSSGVPSGAAWAGSGHHFTVGDGNAGYGWPVKGFYDEVLIAPTGWSDAKILQHYSLTKGRMAPYVV